MNIEEIEELCKKLISGWRRPTDLRSSIEQWEALNLDLSKSDQIKLFSCLVDNDNVFRWLFLISDKLPALASTEKEFISLLEKISIKVKGDLAQGPFIRGFIELGSSDPDVGLALYNAIIETKNEQLIFHAGLILGGVGKKKFDEVFEIVREGVSKGSSSVKATCIRALRVIFEKEEKLKREGEIFEILRLASDSQEEVVVRAEVANSYVDFNKFRPQECNEQLITLAKQGDSNLRFIIANRLWLDDLTEKETEINILTICAQDENAYTLGRVADALAKKGKDFPEESLEIIKNWLKRQKYFQIHDLDYCLQEIGKGNLATYIEIVESWIELETDPAIQFHIPDVLTQLSSTNLSQLLEYLSRWADTKGKSFKEVIVRTLNRILTNVSWKPSEEIIDRSFSLMKKLAADEELRECIGTNFVEIFGGRPRFTDVKKVVNIIESWANDTDWKIRRASIAALEVLAEDKVDSEETVRMLVSEKTKETKIVGIKIRKVELFEGAESYKLLQKLALDENATISEEAREALQMVDKRLQEKEMRIKEGEYAIKEKPDQIVDKES